MTVVSNGKRFLAVAFKTEKDFDDDVFAASRSLFGTTTILVNEKRKIES